MFPKTPSTESVPIGFPKPLLLLDVVGVAVVEGLAPVVGVVVALGVVLGVVTCG